MAISFNQVPAGVRVPFVYVEFDDSRALQGPSLMTHQLLVAGQGIAAGTQPDLAPFVATNADQVREKAGAGSQLHLMAKRIFDNNRLTKTTFTILPEPTGTSSIKTITVSGAATEAGTAAFYVGGVRVPVAIASGDSSATIAAAIEAAMDLVLDLPFTVSSATNVVTLTAKAKGAWAEVVDVRDSYYEGELLPAGVTVAYATGTAGTGVPTVSALWAVLGDTHYTVMALGQNDGTNLAALGTELEDRAGPLRQIGMVAIIGKDGAHSDLLTYGDGLNQKRLSVCGADSSPTPEWEWAAAAAGVTVNSAAIDPARPLQRLPLFGVLPPAASSRFDMAERDLLLHDGIATHTVDVDGLVRIERQITTFQVNSSGAPSTAWLDIETALTLEYLRYDLRVQFLTKYPRHKLAASGTKFGAGQAILTPKLARAEVINIARGWEELGLVENIDQFATDLIVERNLSDPNRLDMMVPPDLVNGARVFGAQIGFLL